jgi:hypothetical protein
MVVENAPKLTEAEAMAKIKDLPNKVTKEALEARIADVSYVIHDHMTVAIIRMVNDFRVVGWTAPSDPNNFDPEVGKAYAYENAFKQLWQLEGYLLREKLWNQANEELAKKIKAGMRGGEKSDSTVATDAS